MRGLDRIGALISQPDEFLRMLDYKRREERSRTGSDLAEKPFSRFELFKAVDSDSELEGTFAEMQRIYVFSDADIIPYEDVRKRMDRLSAMLLSLE